MGPVTVSPRSCSAQGGGTIDDSGFTVTLAGQVSDQATGCDGLTAIDSSDGNGSVVVSADNAYTGGTDIEGTTVVLAAAGNLGSD